MASEWLDSISTKKLLLLAMCADAADTAMQLCRYCDQEDMDLSKLHEEVTNSLTG